MIKCTNCMKDTKNIKFCSRSCSNSYNNRIHPKRKLTKKCKKCNNLIKSYRRMCDTCYRKPRQQLTHCAIHNTEKRLLNGKRLKCLKCAVKATSRTRRKNKVRLLRLFGNKCICCGYHLSISALHFHHVDESTKEFSISGAGETRSFDRLYNESKKCILVCSNCHCEIHEETRDISHISIGPTTAKPGSAPGTKD